MKAYCIRLMDLYDNKNQIFSVYSTYDEAVKNFKKLHETPYATNNFLITGPYYGYVRAESIFGHVY